MPNDPALNSAPPVAPQSQLETVYQAAFEAWTEGLLLLGSDGRVLQINPAARSLLGSQLSTGDSLLERALCTQGQFDILLTGVVPPGLFQRGGRPLTCRCTVLAAGLLLTLTAPGPQTDALQQTARFLDSIIENIPDMIFVKDARELRFQRFNKAGERLLGIPQEDLLGRSDYDLFPKEQADFFVSRDRQTLAGKTVVDIPEEPVETRHGLRWLHTKKIPILDDKNEPIYLLGISADITIQKDAEHALLRINEELERRVAETVMTLRQTQEQLLQSQKMDALGRLAGGVAHDFNNLLTVISGYGELLIHHPESSEEIRSHVSQMLEASGRAADLTRQMLAFSRQQFMQPSVLQLNERVENMHKLLERLIGENISLSLSLSPEPLTITADPGQIDQVIMNLAVNARDAMPDGGTLTIQTQCLQLQAGNELTESELAPGAYALLSIQDTGSGMDSEVVRRIFEPFFTTKDKGQGTGLGLATAYGIIKQSHGHIQVDSIPDSGSVFRVYLPLTEARPPGAEPTQPYQAQLIATETLLLVEDEPAVRKLLAKVIEKGGYRVLSAPDGASALELARSNPEPINLLLTDLVMPGMGGRELAETLAAERPGINIVYMSGYSDDVLFQEGKLDEGVAFIHKPFRPDALLELLQQILLRSPDAPD